MDRCISYKINQIIQKKIYRRKYIEGNIQKEIYRRNPHKHIFYINRKATDHIYLERNVKFPDAFQGLSERTGNKGNYFGDVGNTLKINDFTMILQRIFKWLIAAKNGMV